MKPVLALVAVLGACDENPAEVRRDAAPLSERATWNASVAPVGSSGVSANLTITQYTGLRMTSALSLTAPPGKSYQWRIFRGDCATTAVAANNTAPTGLLLFATVQSYPDVTTSAGGTATINRDIAGSLDSLKTYSVRLRASQTATNWNGTSPIACGNLTRS
jgi:hypothetical protein